MGVYIYSIRAKTVQLAVSGTKVSAHLYSYAYRLTSMWRGDYGYSGYKLTESNTERNALSAFYGNSTIAVRKTVPYVIVGDLKERGGLEGSSVYADVTAPIWYDTDKFPGTLVGWVRKVGRGYQLADRTEWSEGTKSHRDGVWVPVRTRSIMIDGKATYQSEDIVPVTVGDEAHCALDARLQAGEQIHITPTD
jgi:hypothetical protein